MANPVPIDTRSVPKLAGLARVDAVAFDLPLATFLARLGGTPTSWLGMMSRVVHNVQRWTNPKHNQSELIPGKAPISRGPY